MDFTGWSEILIKITMKLLLGLLLTLLSCLAAEDWKAHNKRADELLLRDHKIAEAIKEFDAAMMLEPRLAPQYWQRGIALYYANRFDDCRKQFELHQTVNPSDVENAVWHYLCVSKQSSPAEARRIMIPIPQDDRVPMMQVDAMFRGTGTVDEMLKAANSPDSLFYANLYAGLYYEAQGDAKMSLKYIDLAANKYFVNHYMGMVAKLHYKLRRK